MHIKRISIPVSDKLGSVSAEIHQPELIKAVMTVGHGAGSTMDQPFLKQLSAKLASYGICTVRFNFVYSENHKRMPDRFPVASAAIRAVVSATAELFPHKPIICSGKSFGGRMSSMTLAEQIIPSVKGLIFFGFPLHPAGSPSVERAAHLENITLPMLFLQGTKDALATPSLLKPILAGIPSATLIEFEGADHSFKGGKQASVDNLALQSSQWINTILDF